MLVNKDTAKAVNAAKTLIEYCARYKDCQNCIFYRKKGFKFENHSCAIYGPFKYMTINSPFKDKGAQDVKE